MDETPNNRLSHAAERSACGYAPFIASIMASFAHRCADDVTKSWRLANARLITVAKPSAGR